MTAGKLLGWTAALLWLGALAGPGCGTEPVAVDGCRKIEEARCEAAPRCANLKVTDVDACKRFYRDQCLHGLSTPSDPGAPAVDRCVAALKLAGQCTQAGGCVATTAAVASGCDVIERPEVAVDCSFLIPPTAPTNTAPTLAGAAGAAGAAGSAGQGGAAGAAAGAGGSGM